MSTLRESESQKLTRNPDLIERALALPGAKSVSLPEFYRQAVRALEQCDNAAEAMRFHNQAEEAAVLAKQAKDTRLTELARRISARAWRKLGILLKRIPNARGRPTKNRGAPKGKRAASKRTALAENIGLSKHQMNRAVQTTHIPEPEFEQLVERPGSVSKRALERKAREVTRISDVRTPAARTVVSKTLLNFIDFTARHPPDRIASYFPEFDKKHVAKSVTTIRKWSTPTLEAFRLIMEIDKWAEKARKDLLMEVK